MMEKLSPAAMSGTPAPSRRHCLTLEFMNTVQRVPKSQGASEKHAMRANSATGCFSDAANASTNEPQPDEHASLISSRLIAWFSTKIAFMSCPPMSRMNETSGLNLRAAR